MLTRCGAKRARDEAHNRPLQLTLFQHPPEQRKDLFLQKLKDVVIAKSLHPTEFEGCTVRERFAKLGWEQLLNFKCDKIYRHVVIQWTASLSRNEDELTGIVDVKSYTITPTIIRDLLKVDTRTYVPYVRFKEADLQTSTDENKRRWIEACTTVFGTHEDLKETPNGHYIRHGYYISFILNKLGTVSKNESVEMVPSMFRLISRNLFFPDLKFSESSTEYIIDARVAQQATFPKKVKVGEAPHQTPPQIHVSGPHMDMTKLQNLINDQSFQLQNQQNELILMVTKLQKQLEGQVLEAKFREEEMEKSLVSNLRMQLEHQALEIEQSSTEYIIDARVAQQATFPKKVKVGEAPHQTPPQIHVSGPHIDMTKLQNLINEQSFQLQNQQNELILMVTKLQKQLEGQVLEAKFREEEMKKSLVSNLRMQLEHQALEIERREQESEKRAEEREKMMGSFMQRLVEYQSFNAKQREQENEKHAEEREKMIITEMQNLMERQALDAKHQEQESDKRALEREIFLVTNIQMQIECQASEAKRLAQESKRRAENIEKSILGNLQKQLECQASEAKRQEQESEKCAKIGEKMIIGNLQKLMEYQSLETKRREQVSAKQLEDKEKWAEEMEKSIVTNIQKLIECQTSEAKRREQESEICAEERENVQKLVEHQALEAIRREQESEKQAGEREELIISNMQKQLQCHESEAKHREQEKKQIERQALEAKGRKQELERRAEIRAHAIIWDIERQRHLYEQEQDQLRRSWNQGNTVIGVNEF
nr:hypothetical protein [Tanacetum cinerariifolium]